MLAEQLGVTRRLILGWAALVVTSSPTAYGVRRLNFVRPTIRCVPSAPSPEPSGRTTTRRYVLGVVVALAAGVVTFVVIHRHPGLVDELQVAAAVAGSVLAAVAAIAAAQAAAQSSDAAERASMAAKLAYRSLDLHSPPSIRVMRHDAQGVMGAQVHATEGCKETRVTWIDGAGLRQYSRWHAFNKQMMATIRAASVLTPRGSSESDLKPPEWAAQNFAVEVIDQEDRVWRATNDKFDSLTVEFDTERIDSARLRLELVSSRDRHR